MFKITIENADKEETQYVVYGEGEFNFIGNINKPTVIPCPNYFKLESMPSQYPTFKITNLVPIVVLPDQLTKTDNFSNNLNLNLLASYPLELEEYEILYEAYLAQMENDPTPEFQIQQKIQNDLKYTKVLTQIIKKRA